MVSALPLNPQALFSSMESLADPTRLRLLRLLEGHELGVAALCEILHQKLVKRIFNTFLRGYV